MKVCNTKKRIKYIIYKPSEALISIKNCFVIILCVIYLPWHKYCHVIYVLWNKMCHSERWDIGHPPNLMMTFKIHHCAILEWLKLQMVCKGLHQSITLNFLLLWVQLFPIDSIKADISLQEMSLCCYLCFLSVLSFLLDCYTAECKFRSDVIIHFQQSLWAENRTAKSLQKILEKNEHSTACILLRQELICLRDQSRHQWILNVTNWIESLRSESTDRPSF